MHKPLVVCYEPRIMIIPMLLHSKTKSKTRPADDLDLGERKGEKLGLNPRLLA